jgi:MYXO-CTERM domain-containing protein
VIVVFLNVAAAMSCAPGALARAEPSIPSRDVDLVIMGSAGAVLLLTGLAMLLLVRRRRKSEGDQTEELGAGGPR